MKALAAILAFGVALFVLAVVLWGWRAVVGYVVAWAAVVALGVLCDVGHKRERVRT